MLILASLSALIAMNQDAAALPITVPMAVRNDGYWDRPIEVCGIVTPSSDARFWMLYQRERWLLVEADRGPPLRNFTLACVHGVLRRRDGLSARTARARRLPRSSVSHGPSPGVILRRCSDQASCTRGESAR